MRYNHQIRSSLTVTADGMYTGQIRISLDITPDGMFSGDWEGVNTEASAEKYAALLKEAVSELYPDIEIEIILLKEEPSEIIKIIANPWVQGLDDAVAMELSQAEERIEPIIDQIYGEFDRWVVEN